MPPLTQMDRFGAENVAIFLSIVTFYRYNFFFFYTRTVVFLLHNETFGLENYAYTQNRLL